MMSQKMNIIISPTYYCLRVKSRNVFAYIRPGTGRIFHSKIHLMTLFYKENLLIFLLIWKKNSPEKLLFFFFKLLIFKISIWQPWYL